MGAPVTDHGGMATDEPNKQPYEELDADLSQVLRRLRRNTAEGRHRLANDLATRSYIGAGMRLIDRELGDMPPDAADEDGPRLRVLEWLSRRMVSEEVANGPGHLMRHGTEASMRDRWDPHSDYIADLLSYALWPYHYLDRLEDQVAGWIRQLRDRSGFVETIHELAYQELRAISEMPTFRFLLIAAAAARRDDAIREALIQNYADALRIWRPVHAEMLRAHGLRLRPGLSMDDLAYILDAVADGLSLRLLIDPDAPIIDHDRYRSLFGMVILALIAGCTERIDDPQGLTLDQVVQALIHKEDPEDG
jgi:hypothetical protein